MKRLLTLLISCLLIVFCFASCSKESKDDDKINIVVTTFAPYDWVREIIKGNEDKFELTLLNSNGGDLHNYQPTLDDIILIEESDLFIYTGGSSDSWTADINTNGKLFSLMDAAGIKGESHEHGNDVCNSDHSNEEHIWLSIPYAVDLCGDLKDELILLDPEGSKLYSENCKRYQDLLSELYEDGGSDSFSEAVGNRVIFADRYPFDYLMKDLGVIVHSAFSGCSTESEADIDTQISLIEELNNNDIRAILVIENSDRMIAESVIAQSNKSDCEIIEMNSLQSVTLEDIENGLTYYDAMDKNLNAVNSALY